MAGIDGYTKLCLHLNSDFADSSGSAHTVTANGDAQIDTAIKKLGAGAGEFDGTGDFLISVDSPDWDFGTGDFTIDFCLYRNGSQSDFTGIISASGTGTAGWELGFGYAGASSTNKITLWSNATGSWVANLAGNAVIPDQTFTHIALIRYGNTLKLYIDGSEDQSIDCTGYTFDSSGIGLVIGKLRNGTASYCLNGHLDEIRISKGIARWTSNFTPPTQEYSEPGLTFEVDETVVWNEDQTEDVTIDKDETVVWNEIVNTLVPQGTASYGTKIVSINPLVFVSYSSPAKITKIDITDPANLSWEAVEIIGLDYATDCIYNSLLGYIYVIGSNGKIAEIELADLSNQSIIDTGDTDDLTHITSLDAFHKLYIGTDDTNGEVITMQDAEVYKVNTNFIYITEEINKINTNFTYIQGSKINTDFRFNTTKEYKVKTDFRYITDPFDEIALDVIERPDFIVKIDGNQIDDVALDSIIINHTIDEDSTVQFILSRRHDQLDYTAEGVLSQITDNNQVDIYIDGYHEFINGKVSNISTNSETETVLVVARSSEKPDDRKTINLPLASVNEKLHPYQVLINNPNIQNPYLNSLQVIRGENGQYWNGSVWVDDVENALTFATFALAQTYINNINVTNIVFHNKSPYIDNHDEDPEGYKGIKTQLGTVTIQNYINFYNFNSTSNARQIIDGELELLQNWTYFWTFVNAENFLTGIHKTYFYIGTSLSPISSDMWDLIGANFYYQRQFEDKVYEDIGYYLIGEAPYKEITVKNGQFVPDYYLEDKPNGLYGVRDASYNYIGSVDKETGVTITKGYAQTIADLEYSKLLSTANTILPKINCDMEIMLDGYYYYNPSLLTRINITNTTTSDIYKDNNGFPVSIKTIEINSKNMRVALRTDNNLSERELKEIENNYPDDAEYEFEAYSKLKYLKSDPSRDAIVE